MSHHPAAPNYAHHTAPAFSDHRNIVFGTARVIWAQATGRHAEGYVLPGGVRTQNRLTAQHAAELMHRLTLIWSHQQ